MLCHFFPAGRAPGSAGRARATVPVTPTVVATWKVPGNRVERQDKCPPRCVAETTVCHSSPSLVVAGARTTTVVPGISRLFHARNDFPKPRKCTPETPCGHGGGECRSGNISSNFV